MEAAGVVRDLGAEPVLILPVVDRGGTCGAVAEAAGVIAYLVNGPEEVKAEWLAGVGKGGITSGASTPEELVLAVIDALEPEEVSRIPGVEEDVSFVLPRELRDWEVPAEGAPMANK